MLFSCFLFLGFVAWIVYSLILSCRAKTRKQGLISLGLTTAVAAFFLWKTDPGTMRAEPPSKKDIIGTWECYHVSHGFLQRAGIERREFASRLIFQDPSAVTVENLPDEVDTVSFSRTWRLQHPELTPAGAWTIEVDSGTRPGPYRFVCRNKLGRFSLQKNIDVQAGYEVLYRRVSPGTVNADG